MDEEGLMTEFTSQFIYKPPNTHDETNMPKPIKLLSDTFVLSMKNTNETTCIDCDAKSLWAKLQSLDVRSSSTMNSLEIIQETLIFILENTDWPVGD